MKVKSVFVLLVAVLASSGLACSDAVNSENWRRDLRTLEQQLSERHGDL